jgi:hypothetical protein
VGKAPGALDPKEYLPDNHVKKYNVSRYVALCFPMTAEEKDQNPNVADDFEDTVVRETGP